MSNLPIFTEVKFAICNNQRPLHKKILEHISNIYSFACLIQQPGGSVEEVYNTCNLILPKVEFVIYPQENFTGIPKKWKHNIQF